jgi:hypothetical protein
MDAHRLGQGHVPDIAFGGESVTDDIRVGASFQVKHDNDSWKLERNAVPAIWRSPWSPDRIDEVNCGG